MRLTPLLERNLVAFIRLAFVILAGLGLYLFFQYLWPLVARLVVAGIKVVLPLLLAYLVAVILGPALDLLERRFRINRTWGTLLLLVIFLALLGGLLFLLVSNLIRELLQLYQQLTVISQGLGPLNLSLLTDRLRLFLTELHLPADMVQNILNSYQQVFDLLKNSVRFMLAQLFYLVMSLPHYLFLLILLVLSSFFFTRDQRAIKANMFRLIPEHRQAIFRRVLSGVNRALQGYLRTELSLILLTGLESLIGLMILGVSFPHVLAIVAALCDLIPVAGIALLYLPWALWLLFAGNLRLGLGLLVLYGIISLARQLLEPRMLAHSIGLHPLTTLIAIYIGLMLFGFWGLLIGPAVVIGYKAFYEDGKAGT
jgi:sporulation integral membrane protein YtvI